MQFSVIPMVAVLAATATASAAYTSTNGTATSAPYPTGTGAVPRPTGSTRPFTGGASHMAGSALGLVVAGGAALPTCNTTTLMATWADNLLEGEPCEDAPPAPCRGASAYSPQHQFLLPPATERHYTQQFADMYFLRLMQLKKTVKQLAAEAWREFKLGQQKPSFVERVLDVQRGELCWVVGTVYMELAGKPNVLDDIEKDNWIADPPQRHTYVSASGGDAMMLEDESGRLRIADKPLYRRFVTGCIVAALGIEQDDGTFSIIATQYADLPRQPPRWERDDIALSKQKQKVPRRERAGKLAIVSGLELTGADDDAVALDLLVEYLTGEAADPTTQAQASQITRLVIAGGSLAHASPILSREDFAAKKAAARHYGYDASSYDSAPAERLDDFLCDMLPTIPITLLPGTNDPSNVALPQQPLHPALFPKTRLYAESPIESNESLNGFDAVTNPWTGDINGYRVLATGGQTVQDLLKYFKGVSPVEAMEMMLRWRCVAPTAPDTLWCYPFQDGDPLMLTECPHIYIAGCQKKFETKTIKGPAGQTVLLVSVPKFRTSGKIVLVDLESWDVEVVQVRAKQDNKAGEETKKTKKTKRKRTRKNGHVQMEVDAKLTQEGKNGGEKVDEDKTSKQDDEKDGDVKMEE
ncbi:dna polymerase delta subunit 2 [Pyrenophora seminiperda CCB06]|uniref:DNA-directed DNA polymerase n=1 Tax=Pyrenophora seminiperda CCB06 TaxID=1302712 RepID=A0A3M7MHU9_9PLEO|nr:dna polymerase delta subunit 2 [Pyrenophora seminiperda CCB06]